MDTRLNVDQAELFDTVGRLTADLGPRAVADLDDVERRNRLDGAIDSTGVRGLRERSDGVPLASGVEAALVAEALGVSVVDVAYLGPLLAGDLMARAGVDSGGTDRTVALSSDLSAIAVARDGRLGADAVGVDAAAAGHALVVVDEGRGLGLGEVDLHGAVVGTDLTRPVVRLAADTPVRSLGGALSEDALVGWRALALAVSAADAVGAMRGAVTLGVDYAVERRQYGAPVGSFQAVQHLLAEAHTLVEGSLSINRHASWAVDALEPEAALGAACAASAYVGRAQRTVGETVIQVHGGIGNTWECMAHVFLRRTMHDDALFGSAESLLTELADHTTGAADGLS